MARRSAGSFKNGIRGAGIEEGKKTTSAGRRNAGTRIDGR